MKVQGLGPLTFGCVASIVTVGALTSCGKVASATPGQLVAASGLSSEESNHIGKEKARTAQPDPLMSMSPQPGEKRYTGVDIRTVPALPAVVTAVSSAAALQTIRSHNVWGSGVQATPTAIEKAYFSDDDVAEKQSDGSFKRTLQSRLAWLITFSNQPVPDFGPANQPSEVRASIENLRQDLVIAVDATNGNVIESFQTGNGS